MEAGQVRYVYLTLQSHKVVVVLEIHISKDGKSLMESTEKKPARPARPGRRLLDQTQIPPTPFISCERIGSKLYLFVGQNYGTVIAIPKSAYVFDAKSSGELVKFHRRPTNMHGSSVNIIAAHGRLYHLGTTYEKSGFLMPFEVYDASTKSWDPLPPVPQCLFVPYKKAPRWYMGYAVWGTCILVSLGYPAVNMRAIIYVPVLFNVESRTWHQVKVVDPLGHCFPWRDKAVVVGDTAYALGFEMGSIKSFSINQSGSEEDSTLVYSLTRPYILLGLKIFPYPEHPKFKQRLQRLTHLGDFEFCLVQTIYDTSLAYNSQPFWITTFKIIRYENKSFSEIQTMHSTILYMSTQEYGRFTPLFCYNPDYEPKEVMLTTTKDIRKESNKTRGSSQVGVCGFVSDSHRVKSSMLPILPVKWSTKEKVDMMDVPFTAESFPEFELSGKHSEMKGEIIDLNSGDSISEECVMKSKKERCRKRKVKCSKKKGTEGSKRDYIVSFGPIFIALFAGILFSLKFGMPFCLGNEMRI